MDGEVTVHTVLQIRDEDVHLYGFASERGRESSNAHHRRGVGPKVALAILSYHPVDAIERAISTGDEGALALVSGVGKKTAARIVLELKDKLGVDRRAIAVTKARVRRSQKSVRVSRVWVSRSKNPGRAADLPADGDVATLMRHALQALGKSA